MKRKPKGTRHAQCAAFIARGFVDPVSGERLHRTEQWDADGMRLVGEDDDGIWWGTERAALFLSDSWQSVTIHGWFGSQEFVGHFICLDAKEAIEFCASRTARASLPSSTRTQTRSSIPAPATSRGRDPSCAVEEKPKHERPAAPGSAPRVGRSSVETADHARIIERRKLNNINQLHDPLRFKVCGKHNYR
jgi:hypothetical protein